MGVLGRLRERERRAAGHVRLLVRRSLAEFLDDRCTQLAAAISYYVLFSIFPLVIVLTAVLGLVLSQEQVQEEVVDAVLDTVVLTEGGRADLERLLDRAVAGLGALGLLGLLGLLWSASAMMSAIRSAINTAWDVERRRPFVRGKLFDLGLVLLLGPLVALSLAVTFVVRLVSDLGERAGDHAGPLEPAVVGTVRVLVFLVPLALSFSIFNVVYTAVPAVRTRLRDVWPGALAAAVLFELAKNGLALYFKYFGNYDALYGSIGAVISFLFFVFVASSVLLLGAEVASEWPRVRAGLYDAPPGEEPGEDERRTARERLAAAARGLLAHEPEDPVRRRRGP